MSGKTLWIMSGLPASGKSYYARRNLMKGDNWKYISRDEVRFSMITDDDQYFAKENEVYKEFVKCIKDALNDKNITDVIADATHLNWPSRRKLIEAVGLPEGTKVNVVRIVSSDKTMLIRNAKREGRRQVPKKTLRDMRARMTHPKNDPYHYDKIIEVNN